MHHRSLTYCARLLSGVAAIAIIAAAGSAAAEDLALNIQPQPLGDALNEFAVQARHGVVFAPGLVDRKVSKGVTSAPSADAALAQVLDGSGLTYRREGDTFLIVQAGEGAGSPQGAGAFGGDVDALIVTAQKREEAIQDVPIAISAFSQKALEEQKIEGGFDLLKAIPNVTFSKSNFTSYNFSIRGVGTKAISATTDPGVAVAMNNTTLIQNRLFEQEYFDVERVEVLRGPQGTLYGRNATSGVINVITAKPDLGAVKGSLKAEVGNYDAKRLVGMLNLPIIEDVLAVRLAGAATQRTGYDYNEITQNNVNGRDLWSGRVTIGFEPTPRLRANLLWEHFQEDDDRSRTSKQLCHRDPSPEVIGSTNIASTGSFTPDQNQLQRALFGQGCLPGSLYDDAAFGTPNGLAMPFIFAPLLLGGDCGPGCTTLFSIGDAPNGRPATFLQIKDPYGGKMQSRDLRTIASVQDPRYRAKADVVELSIDFDITDALTLSAQTAYNEDEVYSFQDYNRFNTLPVFTDTSMLTPTGQGMDFRALAPRPAGSPVGTPGVFCDPQLGCSDRIVGFDISEAVGEQFSQELRLQSNFDGPLNFSVGANYTRFETVVDYYVLYNVITLLALTPPFMRPNGAVDLTFATCPSSTFMHIFGPGTTPVPAGDPIATCPYIDPNPAESINGEGHNYFRSKNPYELTSTAAFGEMYWNITEALKLTAGLRYTDDRKSFIPVPSQVLLAPGVGAGGAVSRGYPEKPPINQKWGEFTGRLGIDWKPDLGFTDETMLYAFYSHGYKGGGANPPSPGFATFDESLALAIASGADPVLINLFFFQNGFFPVLELTAVEYGPTFDPEFVDAFELGAKNTLLGGAMTLNTTAFFYDYKDYQVSQIRDRTAVNENFDATIWGLEFETVFAPSRDFRINANLGYLDTRIADGEASIDTMNRTNSDPNYTLVKPWLQLPSNCVVPTPVAEYFLTGPDGFWTLCGGVRGALGLGSPTDPNPAFGGGVSRYDYRNYPELNGGAGIRAQLGGNELPSAPHWTTNIGAQYSRDVLGGSWRLTARTDAYWQSQSWARVYNAVNDKLHGWYNLNFSVRLVSEDLGLEGEFYVKNLLDKSPITDAFLNSDDTALTTNVFVLDPRLVGFSLRKTF